MIAINWERFDKAPDGTLHPRVSFVEGESLVSPPQVLSTPMTEQTGNRIVDMYWDEMHRIIAEENDAREHQTASNLGIWDTIRDDLIAKDKSFNGEEIDDEA